MTVLEFRNWIDEHVKAGYLNSKVVAYDPDSEQYEEITGATFDDEEFRLQTDK